MRGLTDVDALTMSMAKGISSDESRESGARAIAVGVDANTALKLVLAVVLGERSCRIITGGTLAAMLAANRGGARHLMPRWEYFPHRGILGTRTL